MAKIVVVNFTTLDGVIQSPLSPDEDRDGGFAAGGWVQPHMDDVVARVMSAATTSASAFLLGRKTYLTFAATWSVADQEEPAVAALNDLPKYVASTTLTATPWQNSHILGPDVRTELLSLKEHPGGDIVVFGSSGLLTTLAAEDLIDEYTLLVFPLLLGAGKRMFQDTAPTRLTLLSTITSPTGVIITRYARHRDHP